MTAAQLLRLGAVIVAAVTLSGCVSDDLDPQPLPTTAPTQMASPTNPVRDMPRIVVPIVAELEMGPFQEGLALVEPSGQIFAGSQETDTVTVIDAATRRVVDVIAVGADPAALVHDADAGVVYVADNDGQGVGGVTLIAAGSRLVLDRIDLPGTARAWQMALDPARHRLFVTSNDGRVSVVDTHARRVIRSVKVEQNPDGMAVDSAEGVAFVSDGGGIAVIDTETLQVIDRVASRGAGRLTVDEDAGRLYEANYTQGTVTVYETATREVVRSITTVLPGDQWGAWQVALDPPARRAYVTGGIGTITVLDIDRLEVVEVLTPEDGYDAAFGIYALVDPRTDSVFVTGWWPGDDDPNRSGFLHVIDRR